VSYEDFSIEAYLEDWTQFDNYDDKARLLAELARLRRMADAYAEDAVRVLDDLFIEDPKEWLCIRCGKKEWRGTPIVHTATCDVAAHLGLPREKGEGDE